MRSPGKLAVSSTSKFPLAIWLLVEEMSSMTPLRIFWLVRSASLMLPISLAPRNSTAIFRSPWLMASMALLAWSSGGTMARMMRTTMKNTNRTASTSTATKKIMVVVLLRACFWMASSRAAVSALVRSLAAVLIFSIAGTQLFSMRSIPSSFWFFSNALTIEGTSADHASTAEASLLAKLSPRG